MRAVYRVLAAVIAAAVVFQAAAVAFGTFGIIGALDAGATFTADTDAPNAGPMLHGIVGSMVVPILAILLLIVSFFATVRHGVRWAALVLLAVAAQVLLGFASFEMSGLGLLHGVNAFVVLALAGAAARAAGRAPAPAATGDAVEDTEAAPA